MPDDDRRFRRLEERADTLRHPFLAAPVGAVAGGLVGVGLYAWEAALLLALGDRVTPEQWPLAAACAVVGAGLGFVAGLSGLWGPAWMVAFAVCLAGVYLSAPLALSLAAGGAPPAAGVVGLVLAAVALCHLVGRFPLPASLRAAGGAFVVLWLGALATAHAHLLAAPGDDLALSVTVLLALITAPLAVVGFSLSQIGGGPVLPAGVFAATGAGLAWLMQGPTPWPTSTVPERPNVVVVVVEGLRADRIGPTDAAVRAVTPELSKLARTTLHFTQADAPSSWTVPSVASMLTGLLPHQHRAGARWQGKPSDRALRPDAHGWPTRLAWEGYATAAVVGDPGLQVYGLDAGFARWHDTPSAGPLPALLAPFVVAGLDFDRFPLRLTAQETTDAALAFLTSGEGKGKTLLVLYAGAGGPFDHPDGPPGTSSRPWPADAYEAAMATVDREVGRLVTELDDDTVVFVMGDRGVRLVETRGPGHLWGQHLMPELVHVPLLVRAPSMAARRVDAPVSLVDVAPTVLEMAHAKPMEGGEGQLLRRVFGQAEPERVIRGEATRYGPDVRTARKGRYRMVVEGEREQLFDLAADPHQLEPLGQEPTLDPVRRELRASLTPDAASTRPSSLGVRLGRLVARLAGS